MSREALLCPKCGGPLDPPAEGERFVRCKFCGTSTEETVTAPSPPPAPPPRLVAPNPEIIARQVRKSVTGCAIGVAVIIVLLVVAFGIVALRGSSKPSAASASARTETVLWNPRGESVITIDLDGDGVEDFIGLERPQTADSKLFVVAYEGRAAKRLWKIGPIAWGQCNTPAVLAGRNTLAFADCAERVHVHAISDQHELFSVPTSDQVRRLCSSPDGNALYVETIDDRGYTLDLATHALMLAPSPPWCGPLRYKQPATRVPDAKAPEIDGFEVETVMVQDGQYVAIERKKQGTNRTMAVGFDNASKGIRWTQSVFDGSSSDLLTDIASGKLFLVYPIDAQEHYTVLALDVRTGARVWEWKLPEDHSNTEPTLLTLTPGRAYVEGNNWIHVLDLPTGKPLLRLGN